MAKGIIVVDVPETCGDCACCRYDGQYDRYCGVNGKDLMNIDWNSKKPDWCPIKEMPSRKQVPGCFFLMDEVYGKEIGFNDCLDEIEGR